MLKNGTESNSEEGDELLISPVKATDAIRAIDKLCLLDDAYNNDGSTGVQIEIVW